MIPYPNNGRWSVLLDYGPTVFPRMYKFRTLDEELIDNNIKLTSEEIWKLI